MFSSAGGREHRRVFRTTISTLAKESFFVLVADDAADDRLLLRTAMCHATRLRITGEVADGDETIAYLKGHAAFRNRKKFPLPDLLLLDLKMPGKDGFAVLEWLRTQKFRNLTVVVLTGSMQPEHIKRALDLGADLFQIKPRTPRERQTMVLALEEHLVAKALRRIPARHGAPKPAASASQSESLAGSH
jgi:CheY-like chemotaxis protein